MNRHDLREQLAASEQERWAHWQRYLHGQCVQHDDGSLTIPTALVARWERQSATPYDQLSKEEKVADRAQVARYWQLIAACVAPE